MLPEGWSIDRVGSVLSQMVAGVSVNSVDIPATDGQIGILKTSCVSNGKFDPTKNKAVVDDNEIIRVRQSVRAGTTIVSRMNTPELVGANGYVHTDYPNLFLPDRLWSLKPVKTIDGRWLGYWFASPHTRYALSALGTGTSGSMKNITKEDVRSLAINLPPLPEQKKIADILSTWDKAIETTGKMLASAETQKQALVQQLLTGKKRLKGFDRKEWRYSMLGQLGDTYGGLTGKSKEDFGSGKPYITYLMVFGNSRIDMSRVDLVEVGGDERQHRAKKGDIFFTTSSETPDEVGMASVLLDEPGECYLNSFCFGFRPHNSSTLLPEFARHLLRGPAFRRDIRKLAQGATRYNLSKRELMKLSVLLPEINEQIAIASVLDDATQVAEQLQRQLDDLKIEKRALMQQLLTGKRRVNR